ncbi:CRISPR system Cascade subunit CasD [Crossiella equi]|uniref:CRISPR system Cascade subunit CasD n=1 Tax=Crossiella equi TaxID=130796 RepID=A0ABS5ATC5_9PSEU|nr:type I-E CRISPR-associated protein Cas5/CasD [Crossiella equi]MBP2479697.1 CRISPR system Cascade subunit CasD [Crossiella equi]
MTTSLALCFDAPMQSWGTRARGIVRDSTAEPTKSGVIGVLGAALGVERDDEPRIAELAELRLGVRVDREGLLERDYHTTQDVPTTQGTGHRTVVSERYYLANALFLVVLEGERLLLERVADAIRNPRYPMFFGRKAYVPSRPLLLPEAAPVDRGLDEMIAEHSWLEPSDLARNRALRDKERSALRTVVDCAPTQAGAEARNDQPVSFAHDHRRHGPRTVLVSQTPLTDRMIVEGVSLCS